MKIPNLAPWRKRQPHDEAQAIATFLVAALHWPVETINAELRARFPSADHAALRRGFALAVEQQAVEDARRNERRR